MSTTKDHEQLLAEAHAARAELETANDELAMFRAMVEHASDAQFLLDEHGGLVWANPRACERLGYTLEEMQTRSVGDWNMVVRTDTFGSYVERLRRGDFTPFEAVHQRKDGSSFPVEITATLLDLPGGTWILAAARDITERKQAEAERERLLVEAETARAEAEAASRAKAEFLATMSHELRTPLNAIGGYAELIELGIRGPVTDEQRVDLSRIRASQRHLLGLVNEVLDLARVDSGEIALDIAPVRAGDTVDAALALVRPQATEKALRLAEGCDGAIEREYLGDEPRVRQVLVNLLANAVKFTGPGGEIAVTCTLTDSPPADAAVAGDTPYVGLQVRDTGVGITQDQLDRIFEPFTQAEGGLTRTRGGTGLGLAISRRLARLMGGDITVESQPGHGSTFTLWLATPELRQHPRPPANDAQADGDDADVVHGADERASHDRTENAGGPNTAANAANADDDERLVHVGEALVAETRAIMRGWVERLRHDASIPLTDLRSDAELENHAATFVTDIALALRTMGQPSGDTAALLRDGTAILALIAERHGAQRARLGWPEDTIQREFDLLGDVMRDTVRRIAAAHGGDAAVEERAVETVARLLEQGRRLSVSGYRIVTAG